MLFPGVQITLPEVICHAIIMRIEARSHGLTIRRRYGLIQVVMAFRTTKVESKKPASCSSGPGCIIHSIFNLLL